MSYDPGRGGRILVRVPDSISTTVNITAASGRAITVYSDVTRTTSVAMPNVITAAKYYFVDSDDSYVVSVKANSVEVGTVGDNSTPATVSLSGDTLLSVQVNEEAVQDAYPGAATGLFVAVDALAVDVRVHGVVPNDVTAAAANRTALNNLIATLPKGAEILFTAYGTPDGRNLFTYYIDAPLDYTREVSIRGAHNRRVMLAAAPGFTAHHLIRNWVDSDYVGGETDHTVAPLHTATSMNYPKIRSLRFDVNGISNLTCVGLVHLQETSVIESLIFDNLAGAGPTNNIGLALFTNNDAVGNCSGRFTISDLTQYGPGWRNMIRADNTAVPSNTGSINNLEIGRLTTAPNPSGTPGDAYSESPFYFRGVDGLRLTDFENEGLCPNSATDEAQLRLIDVSGAVVSGRFAAGGNTTTRPFVRATTTGTRNSTQFPMGSPTLTGVRLYKAGSGKWSANVIEDLTAGVNRNYAFDATLFDPAYISFYNGSKIEWFSSGSPATAHNQVRANDQDSSDNATGVLRSSFNRNRVAAASQSLVTSGTMLLIPQYLHVGDVVTSLGVCTGGTAATSPTAQWMALLDPSLAKVALTADDTNVAWTGTLVKQFPLARRVTDAAIGTGTNTLVSTAAAFTAADVGAQVVVVGAGAAGAPLGRAVSVTSPTPVTISSITTTSNPNDTAVLSTTAGTTVSGAVAYIGSPVTITKAGLYRVGLVVVAGTPPSFESTSANASLQGLTPVLLGNSTTGLTDPSSFAGPASTPAGGAGGTPYMQVK